MNKKITKLVSIISLVVVCLIGIVFHSEIAKAAVPYFKQITSSSSATTTPTYLVANTALATTTLIIDVYKQNGFQDTGGAMDLFLAVQYTGSSSPLTVFTRRIEYANGSNCESNPTGCDWYAENQDVTFSGIASTTYAVNPSYNHLSVFASTTPGGQTTAIDRDNKVIRIPVLMRWVRIVHYLNPGSARGAVWQEAIGVQQRF